MPNCFSLTKKGDEGPMSLIFVDACICEHLGREVHPTLWIRDWYPTIGLALSCGENWDECRELFPTQTDIIDFLEENFEVDAWSERSGS